MTLRMWDLAGAEDDRRFSPYCWRVKMALRHKGLDVETIPWRFTDKDAIAFSGQGLVPVIMDGERVVSDSWKIAEYLDAAYADRPRLFAGEEAKSLAFFFKQWVERSLHPPILRAILPDLFARIHPKDQPYFRASREKRFGKTLEAVGADREGAVAALRAALDPLRPVLADRPYVSGREPAFADYMLFGAFQWARVMSPLSLLAPDDALVAWRERMLALYGGFARAARGFPV